ncbi:DUF559 domain-containing protein [Corynebacterium hadale]|uniref:endonuclease domain-containing protein n=1 Tax=Corynebacterium hadale TaxID=2026255 RepID=UPI001EF378FC|nr:DUF559 domain-containing protein [Corynebacterium hadale]MCG7253324.1 DUF559 domain-containing protein [Corynebacterium hadale]MCG7255674.1 DUF559 domain-containing protein [Corynebacterium hadale]MCG7265870.1 DUF559 domain-containing protein [Corynebacterium hadale]
MDKRALIGHLIRPGSADELACTKLSATKFIATSVWQQLKPHEQEFLRTYAVGAAAQTAVLVGRSAAVVSGIWVLPDRHAPVTLSYPEQAVPGKASWPKGVQYRRLRIPEADRYAFTLERDTVQVTTAARTAVDIARFHGVRHGVVAMDSLFYQVERKDHHRVLAELEEVVDRLVGKQGIAHARKALAWCSRKSQSPYESLLRVVLRERGIEVAEQMWIGQFVRPDLLWGQLIIEVDGDAKFAANGQVAALEQLERENWLRLQHYDVVRVTPRELLRDEAGVVQQILELKEHSSLLDAPLTPATSSRPQAGVDWRRRKAG